MFPVLPSKIHPQPSFEVRVRSETSIQMSTLSIHGKTENISRDAYDDRSRSTERTNSFVMNESKK